MWTRYFKPPTAEGPNIPLQSGFGPLRKSFETSGLTPEGEERLAKLNQLDEFVSKKLGPTGTLGVLYGSTFAVGEAVDRFTHVNGAVGAVAMMLAQAAYFVPKSALFRALLTVEAGTAPVDPPFEP